MRTTLAIAGACTTVAVAACSSGGHAVTGLGTTQHPPANGSTPAATLPGGVTPGGATSGAPAGASGGGSVTGWCAELKQAGDSVIQLGGQATDSPSVAKAKIHQLVADAPEEIRPGLQVIEQADDKILDGDTNADAELATGPNLPLIQHTIAWIQAHCPGVVDGPTG
jgi:hypothetical protein